MAIRVLKTCVMQRKKEERIPTSGLRPSSE